MKRLRKDFPILQEKINGHPLIYFDNAATTQRPVQVLDTLMDFYTKYNSNIHRGVHAFGEKATSLYERAREKVAVYIGANHDEIIFTGGTTEGINFVASTWGYEHINPGDEIVVTQLEHHSNLIPWQQVAKRNGATLKFIPILDDGTLDLTNLAHIITDKTTMVAVIHVSNVLGTHNDITKIIKTAKAVGARVLVDAAQSIPHQKIDVNQLGCDFLVCSGHKMLAPTGVGMLYIKKELHDQMSPYKFGGGMVFEVDFEAASWCPTHRRFEAGTQPIAQAIGFGVAIDYLTEYVDFDALREYEAKLCAQTIDGLSKIEGMSILGPIEQLKKHGHLVSFFIDGIHSHDVAAYLSSYGICTRAGHNCAQPLAKKMGIDAAVRASFYFYNTQEEVDFFLQKMQSIRESF